MRTIFKSLFRRKTSKVEYPYTDIDQHLLSEETKEAFRNLQEVRKINESRSKKNKEVSDAVDQTIQRLLEKNQEMITRYQHGESTLNDKES